MGHHITYHEDLDIVWIIYNGYFSSTDIVSNALKAADVAIEKKTNRFLVDVRKSGIGIMQIFSLPREMRAYLDKYDMDINQAKRAVLITEEQSELKFLETTATKIGQNLKVFTDQESAIAWLTAS